jgi:catechol 2,3-dioxygenase-like lactoylglutathione lyase family enzyme
VVPESDGKFTGRRIGGSHAAKIGRLHHVEVYVSDLDRSQEFWRWLLLRLGYSLYQQWERGFSYRLGDSYLVFVQADEKHLQPTYHRRRVGLNHLAFYVASRRAVDEFTLQLRKRGANILYEDLHPFAGGPDHYAVYFEDPDRIKIELVALDR